MAYTWAFYSDDGLVTGIAENTSSIAFPTVGNYSNFNLAVMSSFDISNITYANLTVSYQTLQRNKLIHNALTDKRH